MHEGSCSGCRQVGYPYPLSIVSSELTQARRMRARNARRRLVLSVRAPRVGVFGSASRRGYERLWCDLIMTQEPSVITDSPESPKALTCPGLARGRPSIRMVKTSHGLWHRPDGWALLNLGCIDCGESNSALSYSTGANPLSSVARSRGRIAALLRRLATRSCYALSCRAIPKLLIEKRLFFGRCRGLIAVRASPSLVSGSGSSFPGRSAAW